MIDLCQLEERTGGGMSNLAHLFEVLRPKNHLGLVQRALQASRGIISKRSVKV